MVYTMVFMDFVVFGIYPVFILDTKIPPPLVFTVLSPASVVI